MGQLFGQRLRAAREALGLAEAEVAARIGNIRQQQVSRWETGQQRPLDATRPRLAAALEIEMAELQQWLNEDLESTNAELEKKVEKLESELEAATRAMRAAAAEFLDAAKEWRERTLPRPR